MDEIITVEQREKLYNEIWEEPIAIVSKRYGMSDMTLKKRCNKLDIPLPPSGYWKRIKSGQKVEKPPLSKVFRKYVGFVRKSKINYMYNSTELSEEDLLILKDQELSLLTEESRVIIKEKCNNVIVKNQLRNPHQLILDHQDEMLLRKKKEKEFKEKNYLFNRYYDEEILKRNFRSSLPISVSENNIKRVYRILNALFKAVEELDGIVVVEPYMGKDVAHVRVGAHSYNFEVNEKYKKNNGKTCKSKKYTDQSGILAVHFFSKGSYGQELERNLEYIDSELNPFEKQINKIIYHLFVTSNELDILEEIADREITKRWEEEARKKHLEEMRKLELERISKLEIMVSDWDKAQRIREFANSIEKNINKIADIADREKLVSWIEWVREKADWFDPLALVEDKILGKKYDIHKIAKDIDISESNDN